uniref:G_PROTEIN_RECEP_F1_2 domain-containing protein n=1 Tax=Rhabditophanes sp. KR3021 TaxID=114890 RepID=A0AC35U9F1_9BILA
MLVLGILDMITLCFNSLLTGYLTIRGDVFCSNQSLIYYGGMFALGCWCAACITTIILAFSRVVDVWKPRLAAFLFDGSKTWIWLLISLAYFIFFTFFTPPLLYTSRGYALYFDPFVHIDGNLTKGHDYSNYPHTINNFLIIIILSLLYILYFIMLFSRLKFNSNANSISSLQKDLFLQTSVIISFTYIASIIYVYFNYFPAGNVLVILGQITWILSHSASAISFLIFNKSIKRHIYEHYIPFAFKNIASKKTLPTGISIATTNRTVPRHQSAVVRNVVID